MLPDPRQIQSSSFSYGTQYEKKIIIEMLNRATTTRKRVGRKERRKGVRRKKSSLEKGILNACGRSSAGRLCLTSGEPWDKQGVAAKRRSEKREPERPCPLSPRAPTSAGAWVGVAGHWGQGRVWACG